jgi:phosphate-selective porin OprO/OprP
VLGESALEGIRMSFGYCEWMRRCAATAFLAILIVAENSQAQDSFPSELDAIRERIEALEKQNCNLQSQIDSLSGQAADGDATDVKVKGLLDAHFKDEADRKKRAEEQEKQREKVEGYEVGTLLGMKAYWDVLRGPMLATPHQDFVLHLGGRFQNDSVWWQQDAQLRNSTAKGGVGQLEDGSFMRRIRLQMDGTIWDNVIFNMEYAFENFGGTASSAGANNNPAIGTMEECYAGLRDLPYVGEVRIGQVRVPQCLDPGFTSSNKGGTFMEPAAFADAFFNNLAPGVWLGNHFCDERVIVAGMLYRQEGGSTSAGGSLQQGGTNGASIGNGEYGWTVRGVILPIFENEGRCLLHLGGSLTYRDALPNNVAGTGAHFVDFSARPEMRDTIGAYGNVGPGNSSRFVSTGPVQANDATVLDGELLLIWGPLSFQSEWALAYADGAIGQPGTLLAGKSLGNVSFNGGYVQVSYFLTGENRLYEKRHARLNSMCCRPNTPFFFKQDRNGGLCCGLGAWEVAARFSYLNLNDGAVQGGILESEVVGINWYLNTHLKVQFDYLRTHRYDMGTSAILGGVGTLPGTTDSLGIRTQIVF